MQKPIAYAWFVMSLFYIACGLFIAIKQLLPASPPPWFDVEWTWLQDHPTVFNYLMGGLLVAYGIYRLYRSYKSIKAADD
ncbi:MAG: hypothetical protein AAFQ87_04930 [Bacteroidota bacterium]